MKVTQYHLVISGQVQGVGYRFSACNVATDLGLTGWVSNRIDGRVEIVAEGNIAILEQLVTWAKKGPSYATVNDVIVEQRTASGDFNNFIIR